MARYNFHIKDGAELIEDREGSELAKAGERDPERSCEGVLQQWGRAAAHVAPSIAPGDQKFRVSNFEQTNLPIRK